MRFKKYIILVILIYAFALFLTHEIEKRTFVSVPVNNLFLKVVELNSRYSIVKAELKFDNKVYLCSVAHSEFNQLLNHENVLNINIIPFSGVVSYKKEDLENITVETHEINNLKINLSFSCELS